MPGPDIPAPDKRALAWAAFGTHVCRSLVEAMNYRVRGRVEADQPLHLRLRLEPSAEQAVASEISRLLRLPVLGSSMPALASQLSDRLVDIGSLRRTARRTGFVELPSWVDLDVLAAVDASVAVFNDVASTPDQRWALLFDELELAPHELVDELLGALRGSQPRLIFKLSLSPGNDRLTRLDGEHAAVPGQDYEHVPLTYARKLPALRFARDLVRKTLEQQGLQPVPAPERLLGVGDLDSSDDLTEAVEPIDLGPGGAKSGPYSVGSPLWSRMDALARRDASFRNYLVRRQMDLSHLERLSPQQRASRLRKIRNLVVVREYFRNEEGKRRSRKSYALYAGADSILSLPDGNPRMIIALARQLFPAIEGTGNSARVSNSAQSVAIENTLQRFLSLLEAQQAVRIDGKTFSLMMLLDVIGEELAHRLVELDFNDNVRLTFHVDPGVRPELLEVVVLGVNAGALVYVPPRDSDGRIRGGLHGKQFRLSHLLATKYGLPIHLTQSVPLSKLLPPRLKIRTSNPGRKTQPPNRDQLRFEPPGNGAQA
jgi:hypothetical protein